MLVLKPHDNIGNKKIKYDAKYNIKYNTKKSIKKDSKINNNDDYIASYTYCKPDIKTIKKLDLNLYEDIREICAYKYNTWISCENFNKHLINKNMCVLFSEYREGNYKVLNYRICDFYSEQHVLSTEIYETYYDNILYKKYSWHPYGSNLHTKSLLNKIHLYINPFRHSMSLYFQFTFINTIKDITIYPNIKTNLYSFLKLQNSKFSLLNGHPKLLNDPTLSFFKKRFAKSDNNNYYNTDISKIVHECINHYNLFVNDSITNQYKFKDVKYLNTKTRIDYCSDTIQYHTSRGDVINIKTLHDNILVDKTIEPTQCGITYSTTYITNNYHNTENDKSISKYTQTDETDKIKEEVIINKNNNLVSVTVDYKNVELDSVTGYKYASYEHCGNIHKCILKVSIPKDALVASDSGPKYRCNKLMPTAIYIANDSKEIFEKSDIKECQSNYNENFKYIIDKMAVEDRFDDNMHKVCTQGLHYFLSFNECLNYLGLKYSNYSLNDNTFSENI